MDGIFYWTGVTVWIAFGLFLFWTVVVELLVVGIATSISWFRWNLRSSTLKMKPSYVLRVPYYVILYAVTKFWGYRNNGNRSYSKPKVGAKWNGIGDWNIGNGEQP